MCRTKVHVQITDLCRHSLVVMVFLSMSRQIGHISSLCKLRGDTAISVLSVITSWGVLCSSYKLSSHVLFDIGACSIITADKLCKGFTNWKRKSQIILYSLHIKKAETTISGSGKRLSKTRSTTVRIRRNGQWVYWIGRAEQNDRTEQNIKIDG